MKKTLAFLMTIFFCWGLLEMSAVTRVSQKQEGWHCGQKLCLCQLHEHEHSHAKEQDGPPPPVFKVKKGLPVLSVSSRGNEDASGQLQTKTRERYGIKADVPDFETHTRFYSAAFLDFYLLISDHSLDKPPRITLSAVIPASF